MPSFLNHDTQTFYPPGPHAIAATSATTVNLWDGMNMINPAVTGVGTLATLTVVMPSAPIIGETVTLLPTLAVTALTMKDAAGNAVAGAPAALVANTQVKMMWTGAAWNKQS